ncbi:hypothetical protein ACFWPU_22965, partial [Streptomyces sp. NPDC058471]|uniref:hypothetical protein n=1 Tax=Streptomyces sp. NPDC058471 TaxID=3346516 RepID=UPI00364A332A
PCVRPWSGRVAVLRGGGRSMTSRVAFPVDETKVAYASIGSRPRFPVHPVLDAVHGDDQESHGRQEHECDN